LREQSYTPTSDESLLAAISHFFGWLVALIVWATQKDKSPFVRFQAIQALAFDLIINVAVFILVGCMMIVVFLVLGLGIGDIVVFGNQGNPTSESVRTVVALMTSVPLLIPCIFTPIAGFIFIARIIATIQTFQGKDFRYPWLGALVERYQLK
jgi:uncharacterized Tic20 family protein